MACTLLLALHWFCQTSNITGYKWLTNENFGFWMVQVAYWCDKWVKYRFDNLLWKNSGQNVWPKAVCQKIQLGLGSTRLEEKPKFRSGGRYFRKERNSSSFFSCFLWIQVTFLVLRIFLIFKREVTVFGPQKNDFNELFKLFEPECVIFYTNPFKPPRVTS